MRKILMAAMVVAAPASAVAQSDEDKVRGFCLALQASMTCDNVIMRMDTEPALRAELGVKVRGPDAPFNAACFDGLDEAFDGETQAGFCDDIQRRFGCFGTEIAGLVSGNALADPNAKACRYGD